MTPLGDLRVLDLATVVAGPGCARYLADFGATVIKVERPGTGDTTRSMGSPDPADPDGTSLFWRYVGRGKRCVVLDLKTDGGREQLLQLADGAHVVVENMRPGGLEKLGLGPELLLERNPGLVITRVTGFGQDGPYSHRAGFATLAEAMSGFAAINGEPDGGPLLPPIALTDEVAALAAAFATLAALRSGVGQVLDVNLLETMLQLMGPLPAAYAATGALQPRLGSGISYSVPRGTWRCADGRWVAVSTSHESVARRVLELIGLGDDAELATFTGRIEHRDRVDAHLADWIAARTLPEVLDAFERAEAADADADA
jgi:crotonobetainyl-CoA:carnitine CoA-transferase CaiB-like acyl-CoA transferase